MKLTTQEGVLLRIALLLLVGWLIRIGGAVLGLVMAAAVILLAAGVAEWLGARVFATGF